MDPLKATQTNQNKLLYTWIRKHSTPTGISLLMTSGLDLANCSPSIHSETKTLKYQTKWIFRNKRPNKFTNT